MCLAIRDGHARPRAAMNNAYLGEVSNPRVEKWFCSLGEFRSVSCDGRCTLKSDQEPAMLSLKQRQDLCKQQGRRCRRLGLRGGGGDHLFQPSRKDAAQIRPKQKHCKSVETNKKQHIVVTTFSATFFWCGLGVVGSVSGVMFGRIFGRLGRMVATLEWSVCTWCVKSQTMKVPKSFPPAFRGPRRRAAVHEVLCRSGRSGLISRKTTVDIHRRTLGEDS